MYTKPLLGSPGAAYVRTAETPRDARESGSGSLREPSGVA